MKNLELGIRLVEWGMSIVCRKRVVLAVMLTLLFADNASRAAVKSGSLMGFGATGFGRLGNGQDHHSIVKPEQVAEEISQAVAGPNFVLYLKSDGSLWAYGDNSFGQLGDGTTVAKSDPVQIDAEVTSISVGYQASYWIKRDGSLWATGSNEHGEL